MSCESQFLNALGVAVILLVYMSPIFVAAWISAKYSNKKSGEQ